MKQVKKAPVTKSAVIDSMVNLPTPPVVSKVTVGKFDLFAVTEVNEETNSAYSLVSQFGKNGIQKDMIQSKMQDVLYAEGYRSCNFDRDDKSEVAVKFHNQIKSIFIAQMDKQSQELLAKSTEGLNDIQKASRQWLTDKVGTLFGNLYQAMKSLEKKSTDTTVETTVSGKKVAVTGNNLHCRNAMEIIAKMQAMTKGMCDKHADIIKDLQNAVTKFNDCKITATVRK